ncbi:MAG: type I restriction-modification system subunit M N-terminal domain-containing protein, partial [Gammaproteobacteria bacterium AqS3]|nr:type I restriction-modification system subunit M N-terminal domain-containing protein [Gammaproteobacteria bacterium AqS3]
MIQEVTTLPERYENAPEFKDYIFGVLLLKRLSDAFEEEKEQIIRFYSKVGRRDEAAQLGEYKTEYDRTCFFVPESARWSEFQDLKSDLEKKLNKAAKAITADNPSLEGAIFPINLKIKDALLDKKLKEFISYLSRFQFRNEDLENIRILENIYRSYIQADGRQPNLELDHKRLYILSKLRFKNVHINRQNPITYIQNGVDLSNKLKDNPGFEKVNNINKRLLKEAKTDVQKFITAKNLHFLLGAGTSTDAIPVMSQLQTEFENKLSSDERI